MKFRDSIVGNGGPRLSGYCFRATADYKYGDALKSCHTEFCHIRDATFFYLFYTKIGFFCDYLEKNY
jgi:hypothetical protein